MIFRCSLMMTGVLLYSLVNFDNILCDDPGHFILTASKTVPRIGRSNKSNSNEEFEKFFLKASKSVPRIGRRNFQDEEEKGAMKGYPYPYDYDNRQRYGDEQQKKIRIPTWSEIAETFEYNPELVANPEILTQLENAMADDPSIYGWEAMRMKRTTVSPDVDLFERKK